MSDECTCECHQSGVVIVHLAPCCEVCPNCGKRIAMEKWAGHQTACGAQVQNVVSRRLERKDIEGLLIAALDFYAKEGDDGGEIARDALEQITATLE